MEHLEKLASFLSCIDRSKQSLKLSLISIAFNPIFWNIAARTEYKSHFLTKLAGGSPKFGCYILAVTIFSLGIARDLLYEAALREQPILPLLSDEPIVKYIAIFLFTIGNTLVISSMWALGVTGTYLGDYFGILMDHRVTSFPFNVTNNPMYHGSALSFLATGLYYGKPAGIVVSLFVHIMYSIALKFEEPFTGKIYAKRDLERSQKTK